ncbi:choice-of-anchor E domain-containing protein [Siphonobacter sp.]|uniref:T9SS type A sorting domain-containing protein n=1 Tax=Siphonobacter sp. TaxID=1869184 RepID=UPI003B3B817D
MKNIVSIVALLFIHSLVFAQTAPPTSSIRGSVWEENGTPNNTKESGEPALNGILVELRDPDSFELISSTITDASGNFVLPSYPGNYVISYVYPTQGYTDSIDASQTVTVPASGSVSVPGIGLKPVINTLTYCTGKPTTVTSWSETFQLPKYNASLGKLNTVYMYAMESAYHANINIENTGSADNYKLSVGGSILMDLPAVVGDIELLTSVKFSGSLANFDGKVDYAGPSGVSYYYKFASTTSEKRYTSTAQKNTFTGSGNLAIPTTVESSTTISGAGNLETVVSTEVGAGVCVTYEYTPTSLPVSLVAFTVKPEGSHAARLQWSTAAERNNAFFEVQHSTNGKSFETVNSVIGKGTTQVRQEYAFTHENLNPQLLHYYRLKQVDQDGSFTYSPIRSLQLADYKGILLQVASNPVVDGNVKVLIDYSDENLKKSTSVQLYSLQGKVIASQQLELVNGRNEVHFPVHGVAPGLYLVSLKNDSLGSAKTFKVMIQR